MNEDEYENYTDDDYLAELRAYVEASKKEHEQDEKERRDQLAGMVAGFLGVWWYMRAFSAVTSRNIRTYAAVADREAKTQAWQDSGNSKQKVRIINEFGPCSLICAPYVGKVYSLDEAESLVPFHYNCRCTFVMVESSESVVNLIASATTTLTKSDETKEKQQREDDEKRLSEMIRLGDLSPLTTVEDYSVMRNDLNDSLIGLQTADGRIVKEFSKHFIDRMIGGGWQNKKTTPWIGRRSGVTIKEAIQVLQQGEVINDKYDKNQVHYLIDGVAQISFNTESNRLIQINPK